MAITIEYLINTGYMAKTTDGLLGEISLITGSIRRLADGPAIGMSCKLAPVGGIWLLPGIMSQNNLVRRLLFSSGEC
jgi:hypothetical protein